MRQETFGVRSMWPWLCVVLCCALPVHAAHTQDDSAATAESPPRDATLVVQLARDPAVQDELQLKPEQTKAVAALVAEVEYPLFLLHNAPAEAKRPEREALAARVEDELRRVLEQPQRRRLAELLLRAQGYGALLEPPHAETLGLSAEQTNKIRQLLTAAAKCQERLAGQERGQASAGCSHQ